MRALPLLPPWETGWCLCKGLVLLSYAAAPGAISLSSLQTRIRLPLPAQGWLKVGVTLGGSGRAEACRDFPGRERGAGTVLGKGGSRSPEL